MKEIYLSPQRSSINNLDELPFPDRSYIDYEKYGKFIGDGMVKHVISLQATRGCPYQCKYCHNIWPKKHFFRSAENIFREIQLYYDLGIKRFSFVDDIFNFNEENSRCFFRLILENNLKVQLSFPNGLRGDILKEDYIDLMARAGTVYISMALETASPRLQKMVGKNLNLEKLRDNIQYLCSQYPGIILTLDTMLGFPTETREEAEMTLEFIKNLKWIDFPYINILKIFPNSAMEKFAIENGVSPEAIRKSQNLPYLELSETLPFEKGFVTWYQTTFLHEYFLSKERLLHLLPYQLTILTKDEIVKKYNTYLPGSIDSFDQLLQVLDITADELQPDFLPDDFGIVPDLNMKLQEESPGKKPGSDALKILLLDLSQFFSRVDDRVNQIVEAPLGLMYLMTYLQQQLGDKVEGKIAKSLIDFDKFQQLEALVKEFSPDLIGIRCLIIHQDFFHETVNLIKEWEPHIPVITGGPYATSSYSSILKNKNVDLAVLGEGEVTFCQLVEKIIENNKKIPGETILKNIPGIAFAAARKNQRKKNTLRQWMRE